MPKGITLWLLWMFSLVLGVFGMSAVYTGISKLDFTQTSIGLSILGVGFGISGSLLAKARKLYRLHKSRN